MVVLIGLGKSKEQVFPKKVCRGRIWHQLNSLLVVVACLPREDEVLDFFGLNRPFLGVVYPTRTRLLLRTVKGKLPKSNQ